MGRARRLVRALLFILPLGLGGCAISPPPAACLRKPLPEDTVAVIQHGWHTDLVLPVAALRGPVTVFRRIFPGARVLVAGFGKRTFMMAPVKSIGDLLIGPFPGTGTVLMAGLTAPPEIAYDDGTMAVLHLPPGGAERLSAFLWRTLQVKDGVPVRIGDGFFPGSVFYGSRTGYSGAYTCNSWAADALHEAGLEVDPFGVVFAGQTMARAAPRSSGLCAIKGNP